MEKKLYLGIVVLSLVAIIVSGLILVQEKAREKAVDNSNPLLVGMNNVCTITKSSCQSVQESAYGKTLGIDNSYLGIGGFTLLLILVILQLVFKRRELKAAIIAGTLLGGIMSLRFLYVQAFILGKYCIYCIVVDVASVLGLIAGAMLLAKSFPAKRRVAKYKKSTIKSKKSK